MVLFWVLLLEKTKIVIELFTYSATQIWNGSCILSTIVGDSLSRARPLDDIDEVSPWPATGGFSSSFDANSSQKNPDGDNSNQAGLSRWLLMISSHLDTQEHLVSSLKTVSLFSSYIFDKSYAISTNCLCSMIINALRNYGSSCIESAIRRN
jgi:hypothetical protein